MLTKKETIMQSKRAYDRWGDLWRLNCQHNRNLPRIDSSCLANLGIGKNLLLIANGPSLTKQIDLIKKNQEKVDIMCVDKAFQILMEHGITPDFVFLADARVSYEVYCEKWIPNTKNICLVSNVNGNPNWGINWQGKKTYYVNKDNIKSEKEFGPLSGCTTYIHAASNVSNGQIIYGNQILKYDRFILSGYDFSWPLGGGFYAEDNFSTKKEYLNQVRALDIEGNLVCTSENLSFSCRWVEGFISTKIGGGKVVNATEGGMLQIPLIGKLEEQFEDIKDYKRQLTKEEVKIINTVQLNVVDDATFEEAKKVINSDDHDVFNLTMNYAKKVDDSYGNPTKRKTIENKNKVLEQEAKILSGPK